MPRPPPGAGPCQPQIEEKFTGPGGGNGKPATKQRCGINTLLTLRQQSVPYNLALQPTSTRNSENGLNFPRLGRLRTSSVLVAALLGAVLLVAQEPANTSAKAA